MKEPHSYVGKLKLLRGFNSMEPFAPQFLFRWRGRVGAIFFKYNNYKNHIINNKNDKSKILNLRMAAHHW
jgi:hypothetical protein